MGKTNEATGKELPEDSVSFYAASVSDMRMYRDSTESLSNFEAPVFLHLGDPHERLYLAFFDGTGDDKYKDPLHATNVAKVDDQVADLVNRGSPNIGEGYLPGPGTQSGAITRLLDDATGFTHEARVEAMYAQFLEKATNWLREDPQASIRLADIGFSRGAEEATSFARLVHQRGIQDPRSAVYTRNTHGNITHVEYTRPPLVMPGKVAQVVGLFDPVGTGAPVNDYDRRLPPSVISGVQIFARDEHRGLFKSDHIIDPGLSVDGRFLGLRVPGAHSDVGGGYLRNGLSNRSGNLMIDYLNALSDRPFLHKAPEYDDPRLNVVHRSAEGLLLYRVWPKVDRLAPGGYNTWEAPRHHGWRVAGDPYNAAQRDESLSRQFDFRAVAIGPVPTATEEALQLPSAPPDGHVPERPPGTGSPVAAGTVDDLIDRLYRAALVQDDRAMDAVARDYLQSPPGARWSRDIQQGRIGQPPEPPAAVTQQMRSPMEPPMDIAPGMQR